MSEQNLNVLLRKEEIDPARLEGRIVVVLDVLFATTTILAALDAGASKVVIAGDGEGAQRIARELGEPDCVLSGEAMAETLPGFVPATPHAVMDQGMKDRSLVYATTNGTVALLAARGAHAVYAASLGNMRHLARHLAESSQGRTVIVVCSGSAGRFNLEDFYGAGGMVSAIRECLPDIRVTDSALAASMLYSATRNMPRGPGHPVWAARVGNRMLQRHLDPDLELACQEDTWTIVPQLTDNVIRTI